MTSTPYGSCTDCGDILIDDEMFICKSCNLNYVNKEDEYEI